jgi:hypothetical protein
MVWDREGDLHAGGGRPRPARPSAGSLPVGWHFCDPGDGLSGMTRCVRLFAEAQHEAAPKGGVE